MRNIHFGPVLMATAMLMSVWTAAQAQEAAIPFLHDEAEAKAQGIIMPSHPTLGPNPDSYPTLSTRIGEQGTVFLSFVVNTDGTVSDPRIETSSGYPRLDNAAIARAMNQRFQPATRDGTPVAVRIRLRVDYHLRGSQRPDMPNGWEAFQMKPEDYPPGAQEKHEAGMTALLISLDEFGHVVHIFTSKSSGYPDLDKAAENVAERWQATPATVNGKPVKSLVSAAFIWPDYNKSE